MDTLLHYFDHIINMTVKQINRSFLLKCKLMARFGIAWTCCDNSHSASTIQCSTHFFMVTWFTKRNFLTIQLLNKFINFAELVWPSCIIEELPEIKPVIVWWITLQEVRKVSFFLQVKRKKGYRKFMLEQYSTVLASLSSCTSAWYEGVNTVILCRLME